MLLGHFSTNDREVSKTLAARGCNAKEEVLERSKVFVEAAIHAQLGAAGRARKTRSKPQNSDPESQKQITDAYVRHLE
jgi:hypothetical protein